MKRIAIRRLATGVLFGALVAGAPMNAAAHPELIEAGVTDLDQSPGLKAKFAQFNYNYPNAWMVMIGW